VGGGKRKERERGLKKGRDERATASPGLRGEGGHGRERAAYLPVGRDFFGDDGGGAVPPSRLKEGGGEDKKKGGETPCGPKKKGYWGKEETTVSCNSS